MNFWDLFLYRIFSTFLEGNSGFGRATAADLFNAAYGLGLLDGTVLNLTSLQLCLVLCEPESALYDAARTELGRSRQTAPDALLQACPPQTRVFESLAGEFNPLSTNPTNLLGWELIFWGCDDSTYRGLWSFSLGRT
jgi:hypothetical protein